MSVNLQSQKPHVQINSECFRWLEKLSNSLKSNVTRERNDKSACSPFVALNTGHHLLGWTAEYNSSGVASAALRSNSLATASLCTLTWSKNTTPASVNGLLRCLSYGRQNNTLSRDEA